MEAGSRRPDPPAVAHRTVRAAGEAASELAGTLPLFAGGRSFGSRKASQAQAAEPIPGLRGLAFLAYPLHPAGKPSSERAAHLEAVRIPMLLVQGARDPLADFGLLREVAKVIPVSLAIIEGADHSFRVPAREGRATAEVLEDVCAATVAWMLEVSGRQHP